MGLGGIPADSEYGDVPEHELGVEAGEFDRFFGAPGRVVLRIEVYHIAYAAEGVGVHLLPVLVLKDEMREHVACLHQNSLPDLLDMIPVRSISSMVTGWVIS